MTEVCLDDGNSCTGLVEEVEEVEEVEDAGLGKQLAQDWVVSDKPENLSWNGLVDW